MDSEIMDLVLIAEIYLYEWMVIGAAGPCLIPEQHFLMTRPYKGNCPCHRIGAGSTSNTSVALSS